MCAHPPTLCPLSVSARQEPHHHEHELITLIVSSLASAAAAVVVHALWPRATLVGAAASPVLVAVFAELLRRPVHHLTVRTSVRPAGRIAVDSAGSLQEVRVYRARPQWFSALAVALAAFVIGAGGLTMAETLLHRSIAGRNDATTLFGRSRSAEAAPGITQPTTTTVVVTTPSSTTHTTQTTPASPTSNDRRSASKQRRSSSPQHPTTSKPSSKATSTTPQNTSSEGTSSAPSDTFTTPTATAPPATPSP